MSRVDHEQVLQIVRASDGNPELPLMVQVDAAEYAKILRFAALGVSNKTVMDRIRKITEIMNEFAVATAGSEINLAKLRDLVSRASRVLSGEDAEKMGWIIAGIIGGDEVFFSSVGHFVLKREDAVRFARSIDAAAVMQRLGGDGIVTDMKVIEYS